MKRLHRKCFFASAGLHLLLVLTFLLGSAFQRPLDKPKETGQAGRGEAPPLQIVSPQAQAEAPAVAMSRAVTPVQPNVLPKGAPEITPKLPDPESFLAAPRRSRTPQVSTNIVFRPAIAMRPASKPPRVTRDSDAEQVGQVADRILKMISPGATIDLGSGTGAGSGPGMGEGGDSYAQIVKEYYSRNWDPRGVASEEGTAVVKVVIASDGKVVSAHITKSSGDRALDGTIQQALDRVRAIQPFENGAREKERAYAINFNARARSLLE